MSKFAENVCRKTEQIFQYEGNYGFFTKFCFWCSTIEWYPVFENLFEERRFIKIDIIGGKI